MAEGFQPSPRAAEASNFLVVHFLTLRKAVGFIGIALPFVMVIGENVRDWLAPGASPIGRQIIELSLSAYFHTGMRDVFVGSLCAIGVFLLCYKGYERRDDLVAGAAGACALLVALFPTAEQSREAGDTGVRAPDSVTFFSGPNAPDPAVVGWIHFGSAALLFALLAYMSFFLFTRSDKPSPTERKIRRNHVYRICGVVILTCIVAIAVGKLFFDAGFERTTRFVFWFEAIAVVVFGISWLTKGEMILKDRPGE
jgi:hypothetical protein